MNKRTTTIVADGEEVIATSSSSGRPGRNRLACPRNSKQRLHSETLVADLSLKFINLPANEIDPEIEDSQRRVCQCLRPGHVFALAVVGRVSGIPWH